MDTYLGVGKLSPHKLRLHLDALAQASVYFGAYNIQIDHCAGRAATVNNHDKRRVGLAVRQADDEAAARTDALLDNRKEMPSPDLDPILLAGSLRCSCEAVSYPVQAA